MASAKHEPIAGVWGGAQWGSEAKLMVRESGAQGGAEAADILISDAKNKIEAENIQIKVKWKNRCRG